MSLGAFLAGALLRFLNFIHFPSNQTRCKVGNILNISWSMGPETADQQSPECPGSNEWIWLMNLKANKIQSIILRSRGIKEGGARITYRGSCIPKVFRQGEREWLLYPCTHGRRCFTTSKLHCLLSISRHFTKRQLLLPSRNHVTSDTYPSCEGTEIAMSRALTMFRQTRCPENIGDNSCKERVIFHSLHGCSFAVWTDLLETVSKHEEQVRVSDCLQLPHKNCLMFNVEYANPYMCFKIHL